MSNNEQRIYQSNNNPCWIVVRKFTTGHFRAMTNNEEFHKLIEKELDWCKTEDEAQSDLDRFAARHNLNEKI